MAVIMEAFSIREYASRMRSVDLVKCWPFDESASKEEIKSILPPITIKKFRWWFDELETVRLDEEESESLASIRMRRRRRLQVANKGGKAPKKRSIVELFAVAPQVERVVSSDEEYNSDSDSDGDGELGGDCNIEESGCGIKKVGFHGKSKKKDMGMLNMMGGGDNKQKKLAAIYSKIKPTKKNKRGIGITIKDMSSKLKSAPSVDSTAHSDCSTLSKGIFDNLSIPLKKQKLNTLATEAKNKAKTSSKLTTKNHKPEFPWHGVLKNYGETCQPENKISLHKIQNLNKHFALSLKDNRLGQKRKDSPRMELEFFKRNNLKGISFQDMREAEEDTTNRKGHHAHIKVQPLAEKPFSMRYHVSGDVDERFASVSGEDYNEHTLQPPRLDRVSPKELMHATCCIPNQRRSKVKMHHGGRCINEDVFGLPLNSLGELIRISSNENGGLYQLGSSSVLTGPNTSSSVCRNISSELLVNKPYNGSWKEVTSLIKQLELCAIKDYGKETNTLMPSRLSLMEQRHYRRTNALSEAVHSSFPLEPRFDQMQMPHVSSRLDGRYGTYLRSEIIQNCTPNLTRPTMRLMGQEFRIDGRRYQGPEGREFYKDKQIITELGDGSAATRCSVKTQLLPEPIGHPILGRQRSGGMRLPDYYNNRASGNMSHVIPPESRIFSSHDDQRILMQQKVNKLGKGSSTLPEMYPHFPVTANFHSDCHIVSPLSENLSTYRYLKGSHSLLPTVPMFHDTGKNTSRSCFQLENKETSFPGGKLPFKFPYPHSEFRGHIQPSWCDRSFEVTPPRFFEVSGGPDSVHPPRHVSRINHERYPSIYLTPDPSKLPPRSASFQNNIASASIHHPPPVPVHPCSFQVPALLNRYGKKTKNTKQVNPRFMARTLSHGNGTKKRLAPASSQHTKPVKMPKYGSQEDFRYAASTTDTSPNLKWNVQYYHGQGSEAKYKGNAIECDGYTTNMNESGKDSSYKAQKLPGSVPVKVTAGATRHPEDMSKERTDEHSSICSNSSGWYSHM